MDDQSVKAFEKDQIEELGLAVTEGEGWSFEVVSPGPPDVLSDTQGLQSVVDVLNTLTDMEVQAPPSAGLHVHVNVVSVASPGTQLTIKNVANIWAAYAQYHLVIDEFLTPMRINNKFAQSLFLGHRPPMNEDLPLPRDIFKNIYHYLKKIEKANNLNFDALCETSKNAKPMPEACKNYWEFCNQAMGGEKHNDPCVNNPNLRYYTLNLLSLPKLGTLEFRSHSATYDKYQVLHWIIFHVAFVEAFKGSRIANIKPDELEKSQKDQSLETLKKAINNFQMSQTLQYNTLKKNNQKLKKPLKYENIVSSLSQRTWKKGIGCELKVEF